MIAPSFLIGLIFAFYVLIALFTLAAFMLFLASATDAPVFHSAAALLNRFGRNVGDFWSYASTVVPLIAYIIIAENVLGVALDTAVLKPFTRANANRFFRAFIVSGLLGVAHVFGAGFASRLGLDPAEWTASGAYISLLTALAFLSLSAAFREGARLKEEQDLTV